MRIGVSFHAPEDVSGDSTLIADQYPIDANTARITYGMGDIHGHAGTLYCEAPALNARCNPRI